MPQIAQIAQIDYQVHDAVAEIVLDHAPVNALTPPMVAALIAALQRAAADEAVRAVLLRSAVPRRFCAGLDLTALVGAEPDALRTLLDDLYTNLHEAQRQLGKPSIAVVNGAARGGGMTVAISCDMILAGRSASFGYPEIDRGVLPAIHFHHLHRIVGRYRSFELLFTGRDFGADEAERLGLVNRVVDDEALLDEARALARLLAGKPAGAVKRGRAAFYDAHDQGWRIGVAHAVETFCASAVSAEGREGVAAFSEKRAPRWPDRG